MTLDAAEGNQIRSPGKKADAVNASPRKDQIALNNQA
jgi:hypothetical protein